MTEKELGWYAAARAILSEQELSAAAALREVQAESRTKAGGTRAEGCAYAEIKPMQK